MNLTLLRKEIKSNSVLVLIFIAVLSVYSSLIVTMFDPELGESLEMMSQSMPGIFAAFGMLNVGATLIEFITNYLYGFLLLAFPLVFIIILSGRLVTRYVDSGSMAYLLATPNKRTTIACTQMASLLLGVCILVGYETVLCIVCSQLMFPGELLIDRFLILNGGWLCLLVFMSGICFCSSCLFNESKTATGLSAGLNILFLLMQMISQVGDQMKNLRYANPLSLFDPQGIIAGDAQSIGMVFILLAAGFILYAIGIVAFSKRDLPL